MSRGVESMSSGDAEFSVQRGWRSIPAEYGGQRNQTRASRKSNVEDETSAHFGPLTKCGAVIDLSVLIG